jgi:hypothetical protein
MAGIVTTTVTGTNTRDTRIYSDIRLSPSDSSSSNDWDDIQIPVQCNRNRYGNDGDEDEINDYGSEEDEVSTGSWDTYYTSAMSSSGNRSWEWNRSNDLPLSSSRQCQRQLRWRTAFAPEENDFDVDQRQSQVQSDTTTRSKLLSPVLLSRPSLESSFFSTTCTENRDGRIDCATNQAHVMYIGTRTTTTTTTVSSNSSSSSSSSSSCESQIEPQQPTPDLPYHHCVTILPDWSENANDRPRTMSETRLLVDRHRNNNLVINSCEGENENLFVSRVLQYEQPQQLSPETVIKLARSRCRRSKKNELSLQFQQTPSSSHLRSAFDLLKNDEQITEANHCSSSSVVPHSLLHLQLDQEQHDPPPQKQQQQQQQQHNQEHPPFQERTSRYERWRILRRLRRRSFSSIHTNRSHRWFYRRLTQKHYHQQQQQQQHEQKQRQSWPLVPANHPIKLLWDILTVLLSFANAYATHAAIRDRQFQFQYNFRFFCDAWFFIDILLNFLSERSIGDGVLLRDARAVCARYLTTWFVIDTLALVPAEILYIQPIIEQQNRRSFWRKYIFRTKAVVRVTSALRSRHFHLFGQVARQTKRVGMGGAQRLLRFLIKYVPKYLLFFRTMKGIVAIRILRQVHWIRRFWFNTMALLRGTTHHRSRRNSLGKYRHLDFNSVSHNSNNNNNQNDFDDDHTLSTLDIDWEMEQDDSALDDDTDNSILYDSWEGADESFEEDISQQRQSEHHQQPNNHHYEGSYDDDGDPY